MLTYLFDSCNTTMATLTNGFSLHCLSQLSTRYKTGFVPWQCCIMKWLLPGAFRISIWSSTKKERKKSTKQISIRIQRSPHSHNNILPRSLYIENTFSRNWWSLVVCWELISSSNHNSPGARFSDEGDCLKSSCELRKKDDDDGELSNKFTIGSGVISSHLSNVTSIRS